MGKVLLLVPSRGNLGFEIPKELRFLEEINSCGKRELIFFEKHFPKNIFPKKGDIADEIL
ncbi:MAG: hypothetical protein CM15mP58_07450 [Burkholderiaceae bacterium]|nr:MAG: hypothetical protein CM15mP58_07450 [Burkholderiaceae bacterium]